MDCCRIVNENERIIKSGRRGYFDYNNHTDEKDKTADDLSSQPTVLFESEVVLSSSHMGHPGIKKVCIDNKNFSRPKLQKKIETKLQRCTACVTVRKNLNEQIAETKKK